MFVMEMAFHFKIISSLQLDHLMLKFTTWKITPLWQPSATLMLFWLVNLYLQVTCSELTHPIWF